MGRWGFGKAQGRWPEKSRGGKNGPKFVVVFVTQRRKQRKTSTSGGGNAGYR